MAATSRKFWLKLLRGAAATLLVLALLLVTAAWWILGTSSGAKWLVSTALPYAQDNMPDSLQLDIQGIEADTLASIRIAGFSLSDDEGVWLEAEKLVLLWTPSALWQGVFEAQEISARRIHFFRPPAGEEAAARTLEQQVEEVVKLLENLPDTLADLTLPPLRIHKLQVEELALDSGLVDMPSAFTLSAQTDMTASPAQLNFTLDSLKGVETHAAASISGSPSAPELVFDWQEATGGMLGNIAMLATPSPVKLRSETRMEDGAFVTTINADAAELRLLEARLRFPMAEANEITWALTLPQPTMLTPLAALPTPLEATGYLREDAVHLSASTARFSGQDADLLHNILAEATLQLNADDAPFTLNAALNGDMPQEAAEPLPVAFHLQASGDAQDWQINRLAANAGDSMQTTATGTLALADGAAGLQGNLALPQLDARYELNASDLWQKPQATAKLVLEQLKQPLPATAGAVLVLPLTLTAETVPNEGEVPDIAIALSSKNLNGSGSLYPAAQGNAPLAAGELQIDGLPLPLNITARHLASGTGELAAISKDIHFSTLYRLADNLLYLTRIHLDAGTDMQLAGDVTIDTQSALAEGEMKGHIRSTAPLASLGVEVPAVIAANGKTSLLLRHPQQVQQLNLRYDSGQLALDEQLIANDMTVESTVALPENQPPAIDAALQATALAYPIALDSWSVTVQGDTDALDITTEGNNEAASTAFEAQAQLALEEAITVTLSRLSATWDKNRLSLQNPTSLSYSAEAIRLSETRLAINGNAAITAKAYLGQEQVEAMANISALPIAALPIGAVRDLKGSVNADIRVNGAAENPAATWEIGIDGLQNNYPNMSQLHEQALTVSLRGALNNGELTSQLSANAPEAESFAAANLAMPVDISLRPDAMRFAPKGTIDAALRADLILGPFLPLFMPDGIYGTGHMVADITARGTIDKPTLAGEIELHSGQVEVLQTGTLIDAISFNAKASNSRITITEGSATDSDKGRLQFGGTVELSPTMPMDISSSFERFVFMRHPTASATLTGDVALKGDSTDATLKGEWQIDEARITIQNTGGGSVPEMRVTEVASLEEPLEMPEEDDERSEAEREAAREERRQNRPFARNLALDIVITAANQIFLEGFGLTAELKGKVNIAGTAARPKLGGQMETVRGRWEFFSRTFNITRGKAILSENNLTSPLIDIAAEAEADDITAIARITGTTSNPDINFTSIPSLPKDEILSRVMFGRNLSSISPYQALQLADMLRTLSGGGGGGLNPLSKLQNTLGIDELKINNDTGNGEDVTVGVGKYLQDNIYLEVEGGGAENSGKVSVEVDLTPNISVETEARQNAESAVRLNYKYDY